MALILLFLFVLLSCGANTQSPNIIEKNDVLSVGVGQRAYLDPKDHLKITVNPSDACVVLVLKNEPVSRGIGEIFPTEFPCNFEYGQVHYSHFGSPKFKSDKVKLVVRVDSQYDSSIIPTVLHVEISNQKSKVVSKNLPVIVDKLLGESSAIDASKLGFYFDKSKEKCMLKLQPNLDRIPEFGRLINFGPGNAMDCDQFLKSQVKYKHTEQNSPKMDSIPFQIEIQDLNGEPKQHENFQVKVEISQGKDNTPPKVSFASSLMLKVNQFILTPLTSDVVAAEDEESLAENLIFNVLSPVNESDGYLVHTDDQNLAIESFYQSDIDRLNVAFKPPFNDSDTKRIVEITMEIVDSYGLKSLPFKITVIINPTNTLAPIVTKNNGLLLFQGQARPISQQRNLKITDEDNLKDVIVTATMGPLHGDLLVTGIPAKQFTVQDLMANLISYQHDGSNFANDNIVFTSSDGQNEIMFLFIIRIFPSRNKPPILSVNNEVFLKETEEVMLNETILSSLDDDSKRITYVISPNQTFLGEFIYKQTEVPADPQNWNYSNKTYKRNVEFWTQEDIDNDKIFFRYVGDHLLNRAKNKIKFRLFDDDIPPNMTPEYELTIVIDPVDKSPPEPWPGASLQIIVLEFETKPITKRELRYADVDTDDKKLKFTVTLKPTDTDSSNALDSGKLVHTHDTSKEITEFTQSQINHHKISYKPPSIELGITPRVIKFEFKVEDEDGNVKPNQRFLIFIQPVDNKPPVVFNKGLSVFENNITIITKSVLDVTDLDTDTVDINFLLTQLPKFGTLKLYDLPLEVGDFFTRNDLDGNALAYFHGGDENDKDDFHLDVSDGVHHVPIVVPITIKPVDDQPASIVFIKGTVGVHLYVNENGSVPISTQIIKASDPDTDDSQIIFILEEKPILGEIKVSSKSSDRFKQEDLSNDLVTYEHLDAETGVHPVHDTFTLVISDKSNFVVKGSKIERVIFNVTIFPVDSSPPQIVITDLLTVNESQKEVIGSSHLNATDADTDVSSIVCMVTVQPSYGYLENTSPSPGSEKSRLGLPISSFTFGDIQDNKINYVQSIHLNTEPTDDRFTFFCSDGVNRSPKISFPIKILPQNDEIPRIYFVEFIIEEGETLAIDIPILNADDMDVPKENLTYIIVERPKHGRILSRKSSYIVDIANFTAEEITKGSSIVYEHDSSETTRDFFIVNVTDGLHSVSQKIPIVIIPVDDETPRLEINNGLNIDISSLNTITSNVLKAQDIDSSYDNLTYIIRSEPFHGNIVLMDLSGDPVANLTTLMNFTQNDIDNGLIGYHHTADFGYRDLIKFDITDGKNYLINQYFFITIDGFDEIFPDIVNKGVDLPEGGRIILTTDVLSTSDLNSPDELLQFFVTRTPDRGHLENSDGPGTPIDKFTQLDLAGNRVYYVHTSKDEMKMDSFEFEVTDGFNSVFRTFRISISDVDNKRPVIFKTKIRVREGKFAYVTPFELKANDKDTDDAKLKFILTQIPVHGELLMNGKTNVQSFSMQDLYNNRITYQHDGTDSSEDNFSFIVSDGTHEEFFVYPNLKSFTKDPVTIDIKVVPVDNAMPQIIANKGSSSIFPLDEEEVPMLVGLSGFRLTNDMLKAEDRDSPNDKLKYILKDTPKHGVLINLKTGNNSIKSFKQGDVDKMQIYFIMDHGTKATSDNFSFDIVDPGGNSLGNKTFIMNWSWISFQHNKYSVNETEKFLKITLLRRGYLGETSFVGLRTENLAAKIKEDFSENFAPQVQFNPGQSEAEWQLQIIPDTIYEGLERFNIELITPVLAVLEDPKVAEISIFDEEDISVVYIPRQGYDFKEDSGEIIVPIERKGDISKEMVVSCTTISGSAHGTLASAVLSYSDYISRLDNFKSVVRFSRGQSSADCPITIIDDSLCEDKEDFVVILTNAVGGIIGEHSKSVVNILKDENDVPKFFFEKPEYFTDESDGQIEASVRRSGSDLSKPSSVTVQSKPSDPPSANVGYDYIGIGKNLEFLPGVTLQTFKINILDDLGQPKLEGMENFELVLRLPINASIGAPDKMVVHINDTVSDLPMMKFKEDSLTGPENDGVIVAHVIRNGDISHDSSVRCYTRQNSAKVDEDFIERPDTDASLITFKPGESEKPCVLKLVNNTVHEDVEYLRLVLGSPLSLSAGKAIIGKPSSVNISINDEEDQSIVMFEKKLYNVEEPKQANQVKTLKVLVVRKGDLSKPLRVRIHTKDGSAKSGTDYFGISKEIFFKPNVEKLSVGLTVLYDSEKEHREAFTLHLKAEDETSVILKNKKAIVYIQETDLVADVTFPSPPLIVSLKEYDFAEKASTKPFAGYPLVCITPCDPKHPDFIKTGALCTNEGINYSLTEYRWKVAAPNGNDGVSRDMVDVEVQTFFANPFQITLDSIYFAAGSRVQCIARAVDNNGDSGLELASSIVTVSEKDGLCLPRILGSYGAEPFTAKMRYTGLSDPDHPNKVKINIVIPHRDGMLPVISTSQLNNFELTLSPDGLRVGAHRCSNILNHDEISTRHGFISKEIKDPNVIGEVEPYQFSPELRGNTTLRFYKNLNLDDCTWNFETYYDMSELITHCGGEIITDGQVLNLVQSYVSVKVPLYVSYVFHSPVAPGRWLHNDLESELRLTFVYDTAILWQQGISAPEESQLQGYLYPTSMKIANDGRLVVKFKTKARFNGNFVLSHQSFPQMSSVASADQPGLTFTLRKIEEEPTYAEPDQKWEFVSDYAVKDYSGKYIIKLIPCTVAGDVKYTEESICNPRDPVSFDLQVRFQQVSDSVPEKFSLNTKFHLIRKRSVWLTNKTTDLSSNEDVSFTKGDTIYGRIMVDPVQTLGKSFKMSIEKCYVCTGVDGYIPKYNPENNEYGCVPKSDNLLHVFKIIDKDDPKSIATNFRNIPFNAMLSSEDKDPEVLHLISQPGSDGFRIDSTPLFEVAYGKQWFIHCIYTVRSLKKANKGIGKRSTEYLEQKHIMSQFEKGRVKRYLSETNGIGQDGKGTNLHRVMLTHSNTLKGNNILEIGSNQKGSKAVPVWPIIVGIVIFILVMSAAVFIIARRKKKNQNHLRVPTPRTSRRVAATVAVANTHGNGRVIAARKFRPGGEQTEV